MLIHHAELMENSCAATTRPPIPKEDRSSEKVWLALIICNCAIGNLLSSKGIFRLLLINNIFVTFLLALDIHICEIKGRPELGLWAGFGSYFSVTCRHGQNFHVYRGISKKKGFQQGSYHEDSPQGRPIYRNSRMYSLA